jgi:hypothetical protein
MSFASIRISLAVASTHGIENLGTSCRRFRTHTKLIATALTVGKQAEVVWIAAGQTRESPAQLHNDRAFTFIIDAHTCCVRFAGIAVGLSVTSTNRIKHGLADFRYRCTGSKKIAATLPGRGFAILTFFTWNPHESAALSAGLRIYRSRVRNYGQTT